MRVLITLAILGLTTYAVLDCVRTEDQGRRLGPTWAWVLFIVAVPIIGAVTWIVFSRTNRPPARQQVEYRAPDDDPEFLRLLAERTKRHQQPGAGRKDAAPDISQAADETEASDAEDDDGAAPSPR